MAMLLNCIGNTDLHYDSGNNRVRQISTEYVDDPTTLHRLLSEADDFAAQRGATRIAIRALTHRDCLLSAIAVAASCRYRLEAVIPIGNVFENYFLVTYGRNFPSRFSKPNIVLQQQQLLFDVRAKPKRRSEHDLVAEVNSAGFNIERLQERLSDADRHDLLAMIFSSLKEDPSAFCNELDTLLHESDKYTVVAMRSIRTGHLHSMCVAERKNVQMCDGKTLRLAEKAWAVKNHDASGARGRSLSIILHLALQLDAYFHRTHILFAESRSSLIAINRINHCAGMKAGGMLEKHVMIGGHEDIIEGKTDSHSAYRNMNVWFMKYDELQAAGPYLEKLLQPVLAQIFVKPRNNRVAVSSVHVANAAC